METTTPSVPAEQEPKRTRITTVSVRVKRELDVGYLPFLRWMKKNNWKKPEFGMRDATRATLEAWMSAEVGDDMTPEQALNMLIEQGHALVDGQLRAQYPESFPVTVKTTPVETHPQIPEEAFVIASTEVETTTEEY